MVNPSPELIAAAEAAGIYAFGHPASPAPEALASVQLGFAKQTLINVLGPDIADRVAPHAMLVDDLGADSLDMVEIQCTLTDHGLEAPDDAFHHGMTVRDLANLIHQPAIEPETRCEDCGGHGWRASKSSHSRLLPGTFEVRCIACNGFGWLEHEPESRP